MTSQVHAPAVVGERIMVAMVELAPAEAALRDAFLEAERRGAAVHVTTCIRRQIDAAVTLVAETRRSAVTFVPRTSDPTSSAVVRALTRRAHCAVIVVDG